MVGDLARELKVPIPMTGQAAALYRLLVNKGQAERDGTAILKLYEPANDL